MARSVEVISLDQAPERLFEQDKWQHFVMLSDSRDNALNNLTHPGPRIRGFDMDDSNTVDSRIRRIRQELLREFIEKLRKGEISARGMSYPSLEASDIPAAVWNSAASLDFNTNSAVCGEYKFTGIELHAAKVDISQVARWLVAYTEQHGESLKKVLHAKAQGYFGHVLRVRDFNSAYKKAFEKTRGRPSKSATDK